MENKIEVSLQYTRAMEIHKAIVTNAQIAQSSLYEMCKSLKEMRDGKLYKEFGYQNFEDYSENEVGFSRKQSYQYISIAEKINVTPGLQNLGVTKLYLLSTISEEERNTVVEENDIEKISKRELEEKIKEIKKLSKEKSELATLNDTLEEKNKALTSNNYKQLEIIKELENRPIEVAVSDNHEELEKLKKEYEEKMKEIENEKSQLIGKTEAEKNKLKQEADKLKIEISNLKKSLEEQPESASETVTVIDYKATAKIYMENLIDSSNRLIGFIKLHPEFKDKSREIINAILIKLAE